MGHARPTLVQAKCLPLAIDSGRDVLVRARTGSGKTLAYCLPLLQKILRNNSDGRSNSADKGVGAIILVPTRELCDQVRATLDSLTYYCDDVVSNVVLFAGRGRKEARHERERQEAALRDRPDVVVATPAGLLVHLRSGALGGLKRSVETLVVDEADLVLSFGYSNDIAEIVKSLPRICQGFIMSATLSPEVDSLKKIVLHSPVILKLEQEERNSMADGQLKQFYLSLPRKDKNLVIYVFLKLGLLKGKGLFFVNTTDAGYRLKLFLEQFHIRSAVLNAELPFRSRLNIIEQFNVGNFDYLIATDASTDASSDDTVDDDDEEEDAQTSEADADKATSSSRQAKRSRRSDSEYGVSRGLDFRNVSFVVNVDFPPSAKSYSHRVGRTARGGAKGVALSLVDSNSQSENDTFLQVQKEQPSIPLSAAPPENFQGASVSKAGGSDGLQPRQEQYQPVPLDFDLREIEGFRYRVEDVSRAVTRLAVREARASELKAEILNSERLQSHFAENPQDLQLLRHDRIATNGTRVQEHLKHVPKYLLPRGMQVANLNRKKKKRRTRKNRGSGDGARRLDNDPLQAFDGDVTLEGVEGSNDRDAEDGTGLEDGDNDFAEFMADDYGSDEGGGPSSKKQKTEEDGAANTAKIYTGTADGTGQSTAGRNAWKEKHRKGKFSGKKRKSERGKKFRQPLGI